MSKTQLRMTWVAYQKLARVELSSSAAVLHAHIEYKNGKWFWWVAPLAFPQVATSWEEAYDAVHIALNQSSQYDYIVLNPSLVQITFKHLTTPKMESKIPKTIVSHSKSLARSHRSKMDDELGKLNRAKQALAEQQAVYDLALTEAKELGAFLDEHAPKENPAAMGTWLRFMTEGFVP